MRPVPAFECEFCRRLYRAEEAAVRCEDGCRHQRESVLGRTLEAWETDLEKMSQIDQAQARAELAYAACREKGFRIVGGDDG